MRGGREVIVRIACPAGVRRPAGGVERMSRDGKEGWESTGLEVLHASDFDGARLKRPGTYAVCFGATWCPPTRGFVPKFVARNGRLPARLAMADITDLSEPLWDTFRIRITPTMVVFRDGMVVGRFDGRRMIGLRNADLDRLADLLGKVGGPGSSPVPPAP